MHKEIYQEDTTWRTFLIALAVILIGNVLLFSALHMIKEVVEHGH